MLHVYVIGEAGGPYKIGHASNPLSRLRMFQTGYHTELRLFHTVACPDAPSKERAIHSRLAAYRLAGEWFSCRLDKVYDAFRAEGLEVPDRSVTNDTTAMPPEAVYNWLAEMQHSPFFADEVDCARLLGVSKDTIEDMKRHGADRRTALACRALLHRLEPYR